MTTPNSGMPDFPHWEEADQSLRLRQHNRLFGLLAIAAGLVFLQDYMIAPLIPRLAEIFDVSAQEIGLSCPPICCPTPWRRCSTAFSPIALVAGR